MKNPLVVRKSSIDRLFQIPRFRASEWLVIEKRTLVRWLFYLGILIAFYGTLNPWFLWSIYRYHVLFAFVPIVGSMLLSRNLSTPLFDRKDSLYPIASCALLLMVMALTSGKNINGVFMVFFSTVIYFSLFKLNLHELEHLGDLLSASMACILVVSIPIYILYLAGFPLPHHHTAPEALDYSYENYYFFLVDDRFALELIPRFNSVFLEPSHLGMVCITLLYSQIGKWSTWRCRLLFLALVMSFSLAAYLCLVALLFSSAWMKGKAVVGKILVLGMLCLTVIVGSVFYNKGDNLVNQLIVQRLNPDSDDEASGDNRTTDLFTREYEKLASSSQILVGKGDEDLHKFGFGNSGYRVYIYVYGLITIFFLVVFFFFYLRTSRNPRAKISVLIIHGLSFIAHAVPLKFYIFIPLYILTFSDVYPKRVLQNQLNQDGSN